VSQRTGVINQIRAFLLERGIPVRQGRQFLRAELPTVLATRSDVRSPRMLHMIEGLLEDWRQIDERIDNLSTEIEVLAHEDPGAQRLMRVQGIGPIISGAKVAAIGTGATSRRAAILPLGSAWCPSKFRPEIAPSSVQSPGAAIATSGCCSCRQPGLCWSD
jgi:transposase